jgi:hypothetical protein
VHGRIRLDSIFHHRLDPFFFRKKIYNKLKVKKRERKNNKCMRRQINGSKKRKKIKDKNAKARNCYTCTILVHES